MRLSCNRALALAICLVGAPILAIAHGPTPTPQTQPDNTKVNKQDRANGGVTADQQKENKSDRDMAKNIRKAIVADKSLSTYGHNVKVIVRNGTVTLKGPVHSEEEKNTIEAKATGIAGRENVKNELSVKVDTNADRTKP